MKSRFRVLLVSGSLRNHSTNSAALATACAVAPDDIEAVVYGGLAELPHFNPDDDVDPLAPAVADMRAQIRAADAVVFSTPEYAGALPGSFKNLLDWAIGDDKPGSLYEKPVGWINVSASPAAAVNAHDSLTKILGYAHASVVEEACVSIPVTRQMVGDDGLIANGSVRDQIIRTLASLATLVTDSRCRTNDDHQPT